MQVGWAVGAGGEYALTNNWSVKLEYLYIDLGSMSYIDVGAIGVPRSALTTTIDTAQNVIRVGLNYKF
jgi:outer membrane immunogenic protein